MISKYIDSFKIISPVVLLFLGQQNFPTILRKGGNWLLWELEKKFSSFQMCIARFLVSNTLKCKLEKLIFKLYWVAVATQSDSTATTQF